MELKLIIELHIGPDYALQILEMLEVYPESIVLIDHPAEPHMGNVLEYAHILDLANFDRVHCETLRTKPFCSGCSLVPEHSILYGQNN